MIRFDDEFALIPPAGMGFLDDLVKGAIEGVADLFRDDDDDDDGRASAQREAAYLAEQAARQSHQRQLQLQTKRSSQLQRSLIIGGGIVLGAVVLYRMLGKS